MGAVFFNSDYDPEDRLTNISQTMIGKPSAKDVRRSSMIPEPDFRGARRLSSASSSVGGGSGLSVVAYSTSSQSPSHGIPTAA